ncbi:MAG: hypothetical protein V4489_05460 [Chlamydiota bacterium]
MISIINRGFSQKSDISNPPELNKKTTSTDIAKKILESHFIEPTNSWTSNGALGQLINYPTTITSESYLTTEKELKKNL